MRGLLFTAAERSPGSSGGQARYGQLTGGINESDPKQANPGTRPLDVRGTEPPGLWPLHLERQPHSRTRAGRADRYADCHASGWFGPGASGEPIGRQYQRGVAERARSLLGYWIEP